MRSTPLRPPAARHFITRVRQGTFVRNRQPNTVIEPGVDVAADVQAINAGQAIRQGDRFVVHGRTYGHHDGTLYPISGLGFHRLDAGAYKALGVYNQFQHQDPERAREILDKMGISEEQRAAALAAWRAGSGGG